MTRKFAPIICLQTLLLGGAMILGAWGKIPWPGMVGLGILSASILVLSATRRNSIRNGAGLVAWICLPFVLHGLPLSPNRFHTLDHYHAWLMWLFAAAAGLAVARLIDGTLRTTMKSFAMACALSSILVWLMVSYVRNEPGGFYAALFVALAWLIFCKRWFRLPGLGIQVANTLILLIIGLPLVAWLTRPELPTDGREALTAKHYSYRAAKEDPAAFGHWWKTYLQQWEQMGADIFTPDPEGVFPFRLRPGSTGWLFESRISINRHGFRGKELSVEKEDAYRIVALGESTTFGCTLYAADRPWPELLEHLILERLAPDRPVEVINAGVPAYSLEHNLHRLKSDILPLRPDMIISYHGANGFYLLDEALPRSYGALPPAYQRRPLKLLADCEHRLRMMHYRRRLDPGRLLDPAGFTNPLATRYAQAYGELIEIAATNGIRLVLANYAMAVNTRSESEVVQFYRVASPPIHWQVRANVVHTEIVKRLAREQPEVWFVDTHPNLDGHTEKYIDMAHFTQTGRVQMAETLFAGIKELLARDLSRREADGDPEVHRR